MKLSEIKDTEYLEEISLKQAVAAGLIGGATLLPLKTSSTQDDVPITKQSIQVQQKSEPKSEEIDPLVKKLASEIVQRYKVNPEFAVNVVKLAQKHEKPGFPKAKDILALIAIESSFQPNAVSALKRDPAIGLTQVRPGIWGFTQKELFDPERSIETGSEILHQYYKRLRDKDAAIQAYNVGITDFRRGVENLNYLAKFNQELQRFKKIGKVIS